MNAMQTGNPDAVVELANGGWDPRVRMFRAADEVDTVALITNRYVVLLDTMSTPAQAEAILAYVRADLAGRQLLVLNSHADYDHCWGNAVFASPGGAQPAPIIAHRLAYERLTGSEDARYLARRQSEEARFASVRLVPPTISFEGELRIDCGDLTLRLLPAPGHSPDQVVVWIPELRLLLAADAAEHPIPYVKDPETIPQFRETLHDLLDLEPVTVLPCHGGAGSPDLIHRNIAYFAALERRIRAALTEGRVTAKEAEDPDLPARIAMPIADMAAIAGIEPGAVTEFYRQSHRRAVRAMLLYVSNPSER